MDEKSAFIAALEARDPDGLKSVSKAELHNHIGFGGGSDELFLYSAYRILPLDRPLNSMDEMHAWVDEHIPSHFNSCHGYHQLVSAGLRQAQRDGVRLLAVGEDVWANGEYYGGDIDLLISQWKENMWLYAPDVKLQFQMGLSRHVPINKLNEWAEPFFEKDCFDAVDLYGDELIQPIEIFIPIYRRAKERGKILRAHVGEWGTADDVVRAVEVLELNEVQHGIAAASSKEAMAFLRDNNIRLNICPTSNIMLGRVESYDKHPIRTLFDAGVRVTINTDDQLIFGSSLPEEYQKLYDCGLFSAEELNKIREDGFG